jgi:hypothetical protein
MTPIIKATKTINPLHFEDLEPHRFEDLVRRLLYTFRDWSNIEATGRAGSDEGFDIRAWEKGESVTNLSDEGEEGEREVDGRLWQVQGKREKTITPAKIRAIIEEGVDDANPPHGYILAAATNISKAGYDAFREELKKKGVTEFQFWGKDHLEDQLALPENDEILFTFFGLSLSPRRRSRTAELKFNINNKNKIIRLIFGNDRLTSNQPVPPRKSFLLRDVKADHYPYQGEYPDFEEHRRWEEHEAAYVNARGVFFKFRERYAYLNQAKKEWDFSLSIDLTPREHNIDLSNRLRLEEEGRKVERYWRHLPKRFQAKLILHGFVPFKDMLIIDDKGDPEFTNPHILIDFGANGPFQGTLPSLLQRRQAIDLDELTRIPIFPEQFPEPHSGRVHDLAALGLPADIVRELEYLRGSKTLYSFEGKLNSLAENDLIRIPKKEGDQRSYEKHAEITHVEGMTAGAILKEIGSHYRGLLEQHAGRKITDDDNVGVFELQDANLYDGGRLYYSDYEEDW